jgi:hypothetical protein
MKSENQSKRIADRIATIDRNASLLRRELEQKISDSISLVTARLSVYEQSLESVKAQGEKQNEALCMSIGSVDQKMTGSGAVRCSCRDRPT